MPTHTTGTARSRRRERRAQARGDVHLDGRYSVTVEAPTTLPPEAIAALKGWAASNRAER